MYGEVLTTDKLDALMIELCERVKKLYAERLKRVILHGSYADGTPSVYSDVDVAVLVDIRTDEDKAQYWERLTDIGADLGWEYDVMVLPLSFDIVRFENEVGVLPLFRNVTTGGRVYYDG
jgi:predicted nucleotidyltransferase